MMRLLCSGCLVAVVCGCFFFKQKTAYEVRIGDWSSDVCSSDLKLADRAGGGNAAIDIEEIVMAAVGVEPRGENALILGFLGLQYERPGAVPEQDAGGAVLPVADAAERLRSEERRVGK